MRKSRTIHDYGLIPKMNLGRISSHSFFFLSETRLRKLLACGRASPILPEEGTYVKKGKMMQRMLPAMNRAAMIGQVRAMTLTSPTGCWSTKVSGAAKGDVELSSVSAQRIHLRKILPLRSPDWRLNRLGGPVHRLPC